MWGWESCRSTSSSSASSCALRVDWWMVDGGKNVRGNPLNVPCLSGETEKLFAILNPAAREDVRGGVLGVANDRSEAIETGRERFVTYWNGIPRPGPQDSSRVESQKPRVVEERVGVRSSGTVSSLPSRMRAAKAVVVEQGDSMRGVPPRDHCGNVQSQTSFRGSSDRSHAVRFGY